MPAEPQRSESLNEIAQRLGVINETPELADAELTEAQIAEMQEAAEVGKQIDLSMEQKRLEALVETMDITDEQKKDLRNSVTFVFSFASFATVMITLGTFLAAERTINAGYSISYGMSVAMALVMSYIMSAGTLRFSGYGEAKRNLQDTQERLLAFAEHMGIDITDPKKAIELVRGRGDEYARKKRVQALSIEVSQWKKKRETSEE